VERFHKTLRAGFFGPNDRALKTLAEAQAALDRWVVHYNNDRPHQSVGNRPPAERFALRPTTPEPTEVVEDELAAPAPAPRPHGVSRWVDQRGTIALGGARYRVGPTYAGEAVEVVCRSGLVEILHRGVLVATHAERRKASGKRSYTPRQVTARRASFGPSVARSVDRGGSISFSGAPYRVGRSYAGQMVDVAIVAASVQISKDGKVIRVHQIRHDRTKEHGAFATPNGRPRNRSLRRAG
jgi:hypothetical protein